MRSRNILCPVFVPKGTTLEIQGCQIKVSGPLGTLFLDCSQWKPGSLSLTLRALLSNAIEGVSQGFVQKLKIKGGGYRVTSIEDGVLRIRLGYSHELEIPVPKTVTARSNKHNQILCVGIDKQELFDFCKTLERLRKYNIYKQKGIFPTTQTLLMKFPGKPGIVKAK